MKKNKSNSKFISWIKLNILSVILFALLVFSFGFLVLAISEINSASPSYITLDFQNKSGVVRLSSTFNDVLVSSEGSTKKGNGYLVKLRIINPSTITLRNVTVAFWRENSSEPVVCDDINFQVSPGSSRTLACNISDLTDSNLKNVGVKVFFDQIRFKY